MKPHIAATVAELREAHVKLGEMIEMLEDWGVSSTDVEDLVPAGMSAPTPIRYARGRGGARRKPRGAEKAAGRGKRGPYKKRQKKESADQLGPQQIERDKPPKLIEVMRELIATMRGPFSVPELKEKILARYPQMEKRITATSVNLLDMAARGELKREGVGRAARYTALKNGTGTPSDREKAYRDFRSTIPAREAVDD